MPATKSSKSSAPNRKSRLNNLPKGLRYCRTGLEAATDSISFTMRIAT